MPGEVQQAGVAMRAPSISIPTICRAPRPSPGSQREPATGAATSADQAEIADKRAKNPGVEGRIRAVVDDDDLVVLGGDVALIGGRSEYSVRGASRGML